MIKITAAQTVADKVMDLESGAVIKVDIKRHYHGDMEYVLQRTGVDGWLATRELPNIVKGANLRGYYDNAAIRTFIEDNSSAVVWLLTE